MFSTTERIDNITQLMGKVKKAYNAYDKIDKKMYQLEVDLVACSVYFIPVLVFKLTHLRERTKTRSSSMAIQVDYSTDKYFPGLYSGSSFSTYRGFDHSLESDKAADFIINFLYTHLNNQ
jgi:hypothetical protein